MNNKRQFTTEEARSIGNQLQIDWSQIDLEQFRRGLEVELEHGLAQFYFPQLPTPGTAHGGPIEPAGQFDLASIPGAFMKKAI